MSRRQAFVEAAERFLEEWPTRFEGPKPPARYMPTLPDPGTHPALLELLLGVRLFDALPLSYLVPDAELLPAESVRFFYVDPVFSDRLVEGVLSAARTGTPDEVVLGWGERLSIAFTALTGAVYEGPPAEAQPIQDCVVSWLRDAMDREVTEAMAPEPAPATGDLYKLPKRIHLTGLLLRSELVRRWPKMRVVAYSRGEGRTEAHRIAVSRPHRIGSSVMLCLISGVPKCVEIHEPDEGCRFGVEYKNTTGFEVDAPKNPATPTTNGKVPTVKVDVALRSADAPRRVLDIAALRGKLSALGGGAAKSAWVSLALEQRPYVQVFLPDAALSAARQATTEDWLERRAALVAKLAGGVP